MDVSGALASVPEEARENSERGPGDVERGAEEERGRSTEAEGADVFGERGEEREKEDGDMETPERGDRCGERGEREEREAGEAGTRGGEPREEDAEARRLEQLLREAADENGLVEAMIEVEGGLRIRRSFMLSDFFRRNSRKRSRTDTRAGRDAARPPRRNADPPDAVHAAELGRSAGFQQEERREGAVAGGSNRRCGGKATEEEDGEEDWILVDDRFFVKRRRRLSKMASGSLHSPPSFPLCSSSSSSSSQSAREEFSSLSVSQGACDVDEKTSVEEDGDSIWRDASDDRIQEEERPRRRKNRRVHRLWVDEGEEGESGEETKTEEENHDRERLAGIETRAKAACVEAREEPSLPLTSRGRKRCTAGEDGTDLDADGKKRRDKTKRKGERKAKDGNGTKGVCLRLLSTGQIRTLLQSVPTAEFVLHRFLSSTSFLAAPVETPRKRAKLERGGREAESRGAAADLERPVPPERLSKEGREVQKQGRKEAEVWREEGETDGGTKQERHDERGMEGNRAQEESTQGDLFDADDVDGGEAHGGDRQVESPRTRPESSSVKHAEGEETALPRKRDALHGWTRAVTDAKKLWLESLLRPKMVAVAAHLLEANGRDADIFACKRFPTFDRLQAAFLRTLGASAPPTSPGGSAYRRRRRPAARAPPAGISPRDLRPRSVQKDSPFLSAVASGGQIVSAGASPQSGFESEEGDMPETDRETDVSGQARRRLEGEEVSLFLWLLKDFLSFTDLCHLMSACTVLRQELSHALYWTCLSFRPLEAAGTVSCRGRQCRPSAEAQQEQLFSLLSQPRFSTFSGVSSPSFDVCGSDRLRASSRLTHLRLQMHLGPSFGPSLKVTGLTCLHRVAAAAPNLVHLDLTGCLPPGDWCDGRSLLPHLRHLFPSLQSFVTSRGAEVSVAAASAKPPERKPRRADQGV
uniref:Uncharacterized protein n=1 Tax=Toxoplasma gondii TgCATBr9 TaxID=943120 RepID=A0A2T6IVU4_TOXGO|nr:hypothetical protein TGBR9_202700 [Toxoplasma gondii TgCATBr9]